MTLSSIARFLGRRLVHSAVVLLGVMVVVFALLQLVPGDPVRVALGTRYTEEAYTALRAAVPSRVRAQGRSRPPA